MLTPAEYERVGRWRDDPAAMLAEARSVEAERASAGRLWAAIVLAPNLDVCRSVLLGRPVLASKLDYVILGRALRGAALPPADSFLAITDGMLNAVAEAGPVS